MAHLLFGGLGEPLAVKADNPLYGEPLPFNLHPPEWQAAWHESQESWKQWHANNPELEPAPEPEPDMDLISGTTLVGAEAIDTAAKPAKKNKTNKREGRKPKAPPKPKTYLKTREITLYGMGLAGLSDRMTATGRMSIATDVLNQIVGRPGSLFYAQSSGLPRFLSGFPHVSGFLRARFLIFAHLWGQLATSNCRVSQMSQKATNRIRRHCGRILCWRYRPRAPSIRL